MLCCVGLLCTMLCTQIQPVLSFMYCLSVGFVFFVFVEIYSFIFFCFSLEHCDGLEALCFEVVCSYVRV